MKVQQLKDGKVIYEADIKSYNYSVPQFIENGATRITIKYLSSTIIIIPDLQDKEVQDEKVSFMSSV